MPTENVGYDKNSGEIYLICENPDCNSERMVKKQGDDKGIKAILPRIKNDLKLVGLARKLEGIPKIELYNAIETKDKSLVEDYEITPEFYYEHKDDRVIVHTKDWVIKENGKTYYSLLAPAVLLQFIRQIAEVFNIE